MWSSKIYFNFLISGIDFKTMNKDVEPSAFWRAKGVFIPHLVSIIDSNLVVYQESFQSVDNVISKYSKLKNRT